MNYADQLVFQIKLDSLFNSVPGWFDNKYPNYSQKEWLESWMPVLLKITYCDADNIELSYFSREGWVIGMKTLYAGRFCDLSNSSIADDYRLQMSREGDERTKLFQELSGAFKRVIYSTLQRKLDKAQARQYYDEYMRVLYERIEQGTT